MMFKSIGTMTLVAGLLTTAGAAIAGLSPQEVQRLGADLTPVGAEKAANKDGSIPAWGGGLAGTPAGVDPKAVYANPYAADKPLFTITAANVSQYQDKLAPGQIEMIKRFPNYKMVVYPSRRSAALPQREYDAIKSEAPSASLTPDGNGVANIKSSSAPFPIPKTGAEAIWNHLMRYRGQGFIRNATLLPVQSNGSFTPVVRFEKAGFAPFVKGAEPNRLLYILQVDTAPSSLAGTALLVHQTLDQVKEAQLSWTYNPGSRRVLRAPEVSYDSPGLDVDGLATVDDYDMLNGAIDRHDWKLIGKREMIVSYNNYRLVGKDVKSSDIIKPGHMNQDLVRYELHRVWVVEGTVKAGKRHVYGKRAFFLDEDSWQIAHADIYDGRGELWRVREMHAMQFYDAPTPWGACDVQYDLQARRYLVSGLVNANQPVEFNKNFDVGAFSTDALRRFAN